MDTWMDALSVMWGVAHHLYQTRVCRCAESAPTISAHLIGIITPVKGIAPTTSMIREGDKEESSHEEEGSYEGHVMKHKAAMQAMKVLKKKAPMQAAADPPRVGQSLD